MQLVDLLATTAPLQGAHGEHLVARMLSDFDIQARDNMCLEEMGKMRRALRNPDSPEYLRYMEWLIDATADELRQTIIAVRSIELSRVAVSEIPQSLLPFPDGADEQEKMDVLEAREAQRIGVLAKRAAYVQEHLTAATAELDGLEQADLLRKAREAQVSMQCTRVSTAAFDVYTLYAGILDDKGDPAFKSITEVTALERSTRQALLEAYWTEMNNVQLIDLHYFLSTNGSMAGSKPSNGSAAKVETLSA